MTHFSVQARSLAVDECADFWLGCRPTGALWEVPRLPAVGKGLARGAPQTAKYYYPINLKERCQGEPIGVRANR